ncbi:hypothetical protein [Hymenobacter cellulosilyticus]|uniref:Uncharacterized protein n=1 Tax=Hymenobacter cellulosilyticus TaxID=2932248 RepID=A0A8T9Q827_9BACT|nr:hypothetical protein [Hymenobacter cellulosilyticus]UOQ72571.1 hypothetical protein MUN79_00785 [Hymenobacter cellulosilyticus]
MRKQYLWLALAVFILLDTSFSFWQHLNVELDGDMAAIILPAPWYSQVLQDPLGLGVLLKNEVYAAPNRFFAHQLLSSYFKTVPLALKAFVSPIESVYLASALLKTGVQLLLLLVLAAYIRVAAKVGWPQLLLAAALLVPLFHTSGYNMQMGIIDKSVTYTVFYALPMGLLLVFFWPFYRAAYTGQALQLGIAQHVGWAILAVVLAFNGPLVPAVVLIICPAALLYGAWQGSKQAGPNRLQATLTGIPRAQLLHFGFISLLCLYSLYIGLNNKENLTGASLALAERYARLPLGLFYQLTVKLGIPLILLLLLLNTVLLKRQPASAEQQRLLRLVKWLGLFAGIYLLLLPLGGYREYRPDIIRRDTFLPVLLGLIYAYGLTSLHLLGTLPPRLGQRYGLALVAFLGFMTLADKPINVGNQCEKAAMQQIANSWTSPVRLEDPDCKVMSWTKITDAAYSADNAQMLHYWGITSETRLYYQQ